MHMSQIEQVMAIASEGSINKAAKRLYLSQSNLSVSLKQLERELGFSLFKRTGKGVVLTNFGSEFLSFAQSSYREFKLLGDFCSTLNKASQIHFSVASQYLRFANNLFTQICNENENAVYEFSFFEGPFQEIMDMVRNQEAEIGLLVLPDDRRKMILYSFKQSNLTYHPLTQEDVAVIVREGHPLCSNGNTNILASSLKEYPVAVYRDVNYSLTTAWNTLGIESISRKITVKDRATLYELLGSTNAYTIGTHNIHAYSSTIYYSNMKALRVSDRQLNLEIGYITNQNKPLSSIGKRYVELLESVVK